MSTNLYLIFNNNDLKLNRDLIFNASFYQCALYSRGASVPWAPPCTSHQSILRIPDSSLAVHQWIIRIPVSSMPFTPLEPPYPGLLPGFTPMDQPYPDLFHVFALKICLPAFCSIGDLPNSWRRRRRGMICTVMELGRPSMPLLVPATGMHFRICTPTTAITPGHAGSIF